MEIQDKKQYTSPEIIFETDLETKAGSPLGSPIDPGLDILPGAEE